MGSHGASWLERPEREGEEKPEVVLEAMHLQDGDVVAEIGCGTGYFARRAAKRVAPKGKVLAVDIQPEMLELMKDLLTRQGIANVFPILGEETDPKLAPSSVDWILLVDVYHEFQQPQPMLARMRQALRPGGRVALVEYRLEGFTASHIRLEHRMSLAQIRSEWEPAGFEIVSVDEKLPSQHLIILRARDKELSSQVAVAFGAPRRNNT